MWGRELLAHGSLPRGNPYSYSAPDFRWLRHEWSSEVLMAAMFDTLGPIGLKLLKFACTAGTICFVASAESECGAPAMWQATILLVVALILAPVMQFRPQIFDFLVAVRDHRAAEPPQLAWFRAALACDSDRSGLEQSPRRIFRGHRRDGRLWSNCPACSRRPCQSRDRVAGSALLRLPPLPQHLPCVRFLSRPRAIPGIRSSARS